MVDGCEIGGWGMQGRNLGEIAAGTVKESLVIFLVFSLSVQCFTLILLLAATPVVGL
jgi:hypothetical protein